ncbi:MAG: AAA family ATPase [Oscillatoria sp. PMC 1051.18]|nr:AAA family ATPase [Oscillatoria sp. PMC 1050.18]MEC5031983.1 AAA family ATPase [Oscillatoria sp. PMC 1051.18]
MSKKRLCHFLIGIPGSGKSTFASQLVELLPDAAIVSTDRIREQLYGSQTIQGSWEEIEREVLVQFAAQIARDKDIIYDATNAKRSYRLEMVQKLADFELELIGWYLDTEVKICQQRNRKRSRQVPEVVIESMAESLKRFPPIPAEGFTVVNRVDFSQEEFDLQTLIEKIPQQISRTSINRHNRTHHRQIQLHQYSRLIDFERLLHLISLILRYPGIGAMHVNQPETLAAIFGKIPPIETYIAEISLFVKHFAGKVYGEEKYLARDLEWLEKNHFLQPISPQKTNQVNSQSESNELELNLLDQPNLITHQYSDIEPFQRLLKTIRFLLHHPFLRDPELTIQENLIAQMNRAEIFNFVSRDSLRKDIEKILKPYQILPEKPLRRGYYAGTAIFSPRELQKIFRLIQSQTHHLDNPVELEIYETFRERMEASQLLTETDTYPVRIMGTRAIVNSQKLPFSALAKNPERVEEAIETGELLELNRFPGVGKFAVDKEGFFQAYPLQLVFHNIAWYLGFEIVGGSDDKLLRFERLDRLFLGRNTGKNRPHLEQKRACQKFMKLYAATPGIYLGNSVSEQRKYLSSKKAVRASVEILLELWISDRIFRFVSEGTQRFPVGKMKMSPPREKNSLVDKSLFVLSQTGAEKFPNRLQVILPKWSLSDVDLKRWILGFDGEVKVVQPHEYAEYFLTAGKAICAAYSP